jgi:hypothetical protein
MTSDLILLGLVGSAFGVFWMIVFSLALWKISHSDSEVASHGDSGSHGARDHAA